MLLFLFALAVAVLGVGVYAHYNPGVQDVTIRTYQLTGVPSWEIVAGAAGVPLFLFLLHAIASSVRIRSARRAGARRDGTSSTSASAGGQSAKRSWTTGR
jgi:hypothetical protein